MAHNKIIFKQGILMLQVKRILKIWIGLQVFFIFLFPILRIYSFHSHYWDLGFFDHFLYVFKEEGNYYWFLKNHFSPILFLYGAFYKLWASPYFLVLLQSLAVVISGWLLYKFALKILRDSFLALFIVWIYFLHPMMLYQAFWDFHTDHLFLLLTILFFWIYVSIERYRELLFGITLVLLMSVKESGILLALFLSLFLLFKKEYKIGIFGIVTSIATFWFVSHIIGPDFYRYSNVLLEEWPKGESSPFPTMYRKWGDSYIHMIWYILTHPLEVLEFITEKYRLIYMFVAFAPLAFLSLLSPSILLLTIPGFSISLLSTQPEKYMVYHHYSAMVIMPIFIAAIVGLGKIKRKKFLLIVMAIMTLVVSWAYAPTPNGRYFYWTKINDYGYDKYILTKRQKQKKEAIKQFIPDKYLISVSFNPQIYCARLGHRRIVRTFPDTGADFVVVEMERVEDRNKKRYNVVLESLLSSRKLLFKTAEFYIFR